MVRAEGPDRGEGRGWLRVAMVFVGLCLAGAATVALVGTRDPQTLRLAVVGALWAFVLAALAVPRRRSLAGAQPPARREIELRRTYEIELEREVAARREYELQLEVYLRRELEQGMRQDVEELRGEVQRLRSEVLDRLDGELRMERIETTRLIGGSLRALQDEARRLGLTRSLITDDAGARPELPPGAEQYAAASASLYETLQSAAPVPLVPEPAAPRHVPDPGTSTGYETTAPWAGDPTPSAFARDEPVGPSRADPAISYEPRSPAPAGYEAAAAPWPADPRYAASTGYAPRSPVSAGEEAAATPWSADPRYTASTGYGPRSPVSAGEGPAAAPWSADPRYAASTGYETAASTGYAPRSPGSMDYEADAGPWPGDPARSAAVHDDPVASSQSGASIGYEPRSPVSAGYETAAAPRAEESDGWADDSGSAPRSGNADDYEPPTPRSGDSDDWLPAEHRPGQAGQRRRSADRAATHRAAEPVGRTRGEERRRAPDRSAADAPLYRTDDELSRILSGSIAPPRQDAVSEPTGRRRRARQDDEQNDVLSRLLGRP